MVRKVSIQHEDKVRIGPISIITLIAVISMSVLAVLSVSTAQATNTISTRQAQATSELYLNETAAQEFMAGLDDLLAGYRTSTAATDSFTPVEQTDAIDAAQVAKQVEAGLDDVCAKAREAVDGQVDLTASVEGTSVKADFEGPSMRRLSIAVTIQDDATYRIDKWKASAAQQIQQTENLWAGQ